ncbi:hypothetical protein BH23PLA1_BH23PLA1_14040 [soil metagenome]
MNEKNLSKVRRRSLLEVLQGRKIEECLCDSMVWEDLRAEAEDPGTDPLITPEILKALEVLRVETMGGASDPVGPELFLSTDQVVLVPGFMASALSEQRRRGRGLIWVTPLATMTDRLGALRLAPYDGSERDLDPHSRIQPAGALPIVYDVLRLALEVRRYTVDVFSYDWRKDLEHQARRLADRLRTLGKQGRPIHLVAHSQGALVARRALQRLGSDVARRLVRHLVLLGPANFGSFSAVLALAGGHSMVDLMRRLAVEPADGFQDILASMSGLYQLLPWDAARAPWLLEHDLGRLETWKSAAPGLEVRRLKRFLGWGRDLDTKFFDDRTTVILADNLGQPTPGGVSFDPDGVRPDPEHHLPGDGTIPHSCAVLPGVPTYLASGVEHSLMATSRQVIDAVRAALTDRAIPLPAISSNPVDHLGSRSRPWPFTGSPVMVLESSGRPDAIPALNGTFLSSYDRTRAQNGRCGAAHLYRQDQLLPGVEEHCPRRPPASSVSHVSYQVSPGVASKPAPMTRELILEASQLLPFHFLRDGDRVGRAVLKIQRVDGSAGTAFLVASDILLTNHHVLPDRDTAASAFALANFERRPPDGDSGRSAVVRLDPETLFMTNAELDFTFCGVQGLEASGLGVVPLDRNSLSILRTERVNIVQHPRGRPKEVALQDNHVVYDDNIVLHYSCDTEPGSSGSPVFNNQWTLVALHHASVRTEDPGGRVAPSTGDDEDRYLNEGIRLSAIAAWLESAEPETLADANQLARLRSCFQGLDPQIGYFGALGRRAQGRSAADFLVELYRRGPNTGLGGLDVGFWDLGGPNSPLPRRMAEVSRTIADMGVDLWCLAHVGSEEVHALCEHLETHFELVYQVLVEQPEGAPPLAVLFRQDRTLSVEPLGSPDGQLPACLRVRVATGSGPADMATVHLMPLSGLGANGTPQPTRTDELIQNLGRQSRQAETDQTQDWALLGGFTFPIDSEALDGTDFDLILAAGHGQAVALLTGARSHVDRVFVTPNLEPVADPNNRLIITRDRDLPPSALAFGTSQPIALRLVLRSLPVPVPTPPKTKVPRRERELPDLTPKLADLDRLEDSLAELLRPVIARLLAEAHRGPASNP